MLPHENVASLLLVLCKSNLEKEFANLYSNYFINILINRVVNTLDFEVYNLLATNGIFLKV